MEQKTNAYWYNHPFGKEPKASREKYLKLAEEVRVKEYPQINKYEKQIGHSIDSEWLHDLALHTQIVIKDSPLCYAHGRVLYAALSNYIEEHPPATPTDRITIWETGTARGFSALCMARALKDQQRAGTIVTFDVLPHRTSMYWNCIDDCEDRKTRAELLDPWKNLLQEYIIFHQGDTRTELPKIQAGRIHFAFLDGAHSYEDVIFEFSQIRELQQPGDIVVYDDYTPQQFPGLVRAVDEICTKNVYQRIDLQAHAGRGYVVAEKK
jgi:hypothetical protein